MKENEEILGFRKSAAYLLMAAANFQLAGNLDDPEILAFIRKLWGHTSNNFRALGTGENDWHTPTEYIEAAREVMDYIGHMTNTLEGGDHEDEQTKW